MEFDFKDILKINLHNHSTMSDGTLIIPAMIGVGIEEYGLDVIGVTDHFMTEKVGSVVDFESLPKYIEAIKDRSKFYLKKGKHVLAGLELDLTSELLLNDLPRLAELSETDLDYILVEGVMTRKCYERVIKLREIIPEKPIGFAHWNIRERFSLETFCEMIPEIIENKIFIEVTTGSKSMVQECKDKWVPYFENNINYYKEFIKCGGMISLGTDTHFRISDLGDFVKGYEFFWNNDIPDGVLRFLDYLKSEILENGTG